LLNPEERVSLELAERGFELATFVPVQHAFAPIGLTDKLNSAAAVVRVTWPSARRCELELRDGGAFLAYSEQKPATVTVAGQLAAFSHETDSGALRVQSEAKGRHALVVTW
jgi:hypothetical protein